jgi:signal transduction histidine kinase
MRLPSPTDEIIKAIGRAVHDMCQPLTALQCRLELGEMLATEDARQEAIRDALVECGRLTASVQQMRSLVSSALDLETFSSQQA